MKSENSLYHKDDIDDTRASNFDDGRRPDELSTMSTTFNAY